MSLSTTFPLARTLFRSLANARRIKYLHSRSSFRQSAGATPRTLTQRSLGVLDSWPFRAEGEPIWQPWSGFIVIFAITVFLYSIRE